MTNQSRNNGAGISPEFYATLGLELDTQQGLAYSLVKDIVEKYGVGEKALDYGCGAGRSTRLLRQIGFEQVVGVDVNQEMLDMATEKEIPGISYERIESGVLPFKDNTFNLAFSGLVILEISSAPEVHKVLGELHRVVAPGGAVIILTCTREGHLNGSDSFEPVLTVEQQANLKSGDAVPTRVKETGQVFTDYYWSEEFLRTALQEAGLKVLEVRLSKAVTPQSNEPLAPKPKSPYVIYIAQK
ncbi:MAG TPA: class I SAM-dependent methyltransferase [Candidatus Saccharimonadales bacterium]|nr:class I SAM-dependent methyltransferase [Candidatus Saccharimonadales bacterium]